MTFAGHRLPRAAWFPLVTGFLLAAAPPAAAQQVGVGVTRAVSGNPEFADAVGPAVHTRLEFRPGWSITFMLERLYGESVRESLVCRNYTPPVVCRSEETRNTVRLSGFRTAVERTLVSGERGRGGAGVGLSFNQVRAESRGTESGLQGDIWEPSAGQVGGLVFLTGGVAPIPNFGLMMTAKLTSHWVNLDACSDARYDPFCTPAVFHEIQLGLAYAFPR